MIKEIVTEDILEESYLSPVITYLTKKVRIKDEVLQNIFLVVYRGKLIWAKDLDTYDSWFYICNGDMFEAYKDDKDIVKFLWAEKKRSPEYERIQIIRQIKKYNYERGNKMEEIFDGKVKGNELECYDWEDGDELRLKDISYFEKFKDLPEKVYRAYNKRTKETGIVLESQVYVLPKE